MSLHGETLAHENVVLYCGDCLDVLKTFDANSVDSFVTDPPYGLEFMGKGWDGADGFRRSLNKADVGRASVHGRTSKRGPEYRAGALFQEFMHAVAVECLRVLKPGGHLLSFGGTRTYHRMACAIEDAGFEIRDSIQWLYGSGFPKSLDISKAIDKAAGVEREVVGTKKITGRNGDAFGYGPEQHQTRFATGDIEITAPTTDAAREWSGFGTALKPACEPIVLARKPLIGTIAENVLKHGTGVLNIDGCRVDGEPKAFGNGTGRHGGQLAGGGENSHTRGAWSSAQGRWPANVIHDGSDEVVEAFPNAPGQQRSTGPEFDRSANVYGKFAGVTPAEPRGDSGSAAKHPTVKPLDLMQYLVRLVTPRGGLVLDPFAGTGTTGEACIREGMRCILIEREPEYQDDIRRRMKLAMSGVDERKRESMKAAGKIKTEFEPGTLFAASQADRAGAA